ncbi:MarR family transcriptional regulator [Actinomadura madurae]|uniref:DNA-binding transcriptional regulator, MarR family n=2 Tax=Actinomadura madurae TaxID=1993 RepID=A0A1I5G833_9ACTN|nr:transposase [Actinomadura madurae]SFO32013.1 hypothetical protein SAMN04489713_10570 [Actinomadura madurae]
MTTTEIPSIDQMSDEELARQPAAYWTGVAYESVIGFIRAEQARHGSTQPQFWLLRNLSPHDISPDGQGMTIPELAHAMRTYLRPEDDLEAEAEALLARGWLRRDDDGRLWITPEGEEGRRAIKQLAPEITARIHEGIDDADYVAALKVLGRMIRNTSGPG